MDFLDLLGNVIFIGLCTYVVKDWFSRIDPVPLVSGKKVLITGASRGIGEKIAYYYARCGASLFLVARDEKRLKEVVEQCREIGRTGSTFHYMSVDFKESAAAEKTIKTAVEKLGGLDIMTLNHAWLTRMEPWGTGSNTVEHLDDMMTINFISYAHLTAHALPHLKESKGYLCVVGSGAGKIGSPYTANYSASKFALDGFFSSIRQELKLQKQQVSVTYAVIGFIATESGNEGVKNVVNFPTQSAEPMAAATAIVHGTVSRCREVHFPWWQGLTPMIVLNGICPGLLDYATRNLYANVK